MAEEYDASALDNATISITEALESHDNFAATSLWGVTGYKKQSRQMQFIDSMGYVFKVEVTEVEMNNG